MAIEDGVDDGTTNLTIHPQPPASPSADNTTYRPAPKLGEAGAAP